MGPLSRHTHRYVAVAMIGISWLLIGAGPGRSLPPYPTEPAAANLRLAQMASIQGDLGHAAALLETNRVLQPNSYQWPAQEGVLYERWANLIMRSQETEAATPYTDKALALLDASLRLAVSQGVDPHVRARLWLAVANTNLDAQRLVAASEAADHVLSIQPGHMEAEYIMGLALQGRSIDVEGHDTPASDALRRRADSHFLNLLNQLEIRGESENLGWQYSLAYYFLGIDSYADGRDADAQRYLSTWTQKIAELRRRHLWPSKKQWMESIAEHILKSIAHDGTA